MPIRPFFFIVSCPLLSRSFKFSAIAPINIPDVSDNSAQGTIYMSRIGSVNSSLWSQTALINLDSHVLQRNVITNISQRPKIFFRLKHSNMIGFYCDYMFVDMQDCPLEIFQFKKPNLQFLKIVA